MTYQLILILFRCDLGDVEDPGRKIRHKCPYPETRFSGESSSLLLSLYSSKIPISQNMRILVLYLWFSDEFFDISLFLKNVNAKSLKSAEDEPRKMRQDEMTSQWQPQNSWEVARTNEGIHEETILKKAKNEMTGLQLDAG